GRTIKEFVSGVLLVPTIFGALWFTVFGGSGINLEYFQGANIIEDINNFGTESALFSMLEHFPFTTFVSIIAVLLISTFFITSVDSATFVFGLQSIGGSLDRVIKCKMIWVFI